MSKKVKVEGEGEEVRGKVEKVHERLHKRAAEMDKPQGETYEATSAGFVRWCVDRNIRRPVMLWKDYCDIANLAAKIDEAGGAASALCEAMNQIRAEYFDNIKQFLIDCAEGVTREKVRSRGTIPVELRSLWLEAERNARTNLSPRQQRLIEKYTRKSDEVEAIRREQEARRVAKVGKFLRSKGASAKGEDRGQKEEGQ